MDKASEIIVNLLVKGDKVKLTAPKKLSAGKPVVVEVCEVRVNGIFGWEVGTDKETHDPLTYEWWGIEKIEIVERRKNWFLY